MLIPQDGITFHFFDVCIGEGRPSLFGMALTADSDKAFLDDTGIAIGYEEYGSPYVDQSGSVQVGFGQVGFV